MVSFRYYATISRNLPIGKMVPSQFLAWIKRFLEYMDRFSGLSALRLYPKEKSWRKSGFRVLWVAVGYFCHC